MKSDQLIQVSGSQGEGGGALLRTALALSALTQQPIKINNIRGALRKQGLQPEDLLYLQAVTALTKAQCTGDELDSNTLSFAPKHQIRPIDIELDASSIQSGKVPANIIVVAEALLPLLAKAGGYSHLVLAGETHNRNTITFDAFEKGPLYAHKQQGIYAYPALKKTGFGYGTIGSAYLEVEPSQLEPLEWKERGDVAKAGITISTTDQAPDKVQDAQSKAAKILNTFNFEESEVELHEVPGRESGMAIAFWVHFEKGCFCATSCSHKADSLSKLISKVEEDIRSWLKTEATVDPFIADQILLPACLSEGITTYSTPFVTRRLVTMIQIIKQFLPIHITLKGNIGQFGTITIKR